MGKVSLIMIVFIVCCFTVSGKEKALSKELAYKGGVWQNEEKLRPEEVKALMAGSEALIFYKKGRTRLVFGSALAASGLLVLGYDMVSRGAGYEGNNVALAVGATSAVVGVIMILTGEKKIKHSLRLYNSQTDNKTSYRVDFGFNRNGLGLALTF